MKSSLLYYSADYFLPLWLQRLNQFENRIPQKLEPESVVSVETFYNYT